MNQEEQSQEMDAVFQGVEFVRLRSGRSYLHAAEDGRSVCLDTRRASYNAVWAVTPRFFPPKAKYCVLLRSVYGRYLGAPDATVRGRRGRRGCLCPCSSTCHAAAQRDYDEEEIPAILWRVDSTSTSRQGVVRLLDASERYLRANLRCLLPCRSGVSVSACSGLGKATQWVVESVPRGARPNQDLPIAPDSLFARVCPPLSRLCVRYFSSEREIRFVRADGFGVFSEDNWRSTQYTGRPMAPLKRKLVDLLPQVYGFGDQYTLCIRAGLYGEPTPLAINLPRSRERLDIVLFPYAAAAEDRFIYPDVNAVAVAGAAAPAHNEPAP